MANLNTEHYLRHSLRSLGGDNKIIYCTSKLPSCYSKTTVLLYNHAVGLNYSDVCLSSVIEYQTPQAYNTKHKRISKVSELKTKQNRLLLRSRSSPLPLLRSRSSAHAPLRSMFSVFRLLSLISISHTAGTR